MEVVFPKSPHVQKPAYITMIIDSPKDGSTIAIGFDPTNGREIHCLRIDGYAGETMYAGPYERKKFSRLHENFHKQKTVKYRVIKNKTAHRSWYPSWTIGTTCFQPKLYLWR